MLTTLVFIASLVATDTPAPALPAGHPAIGEPSSSQPALPAGHPAIGSPAPTSGSGAAGMGQLPAGHPKLGTGDMSPEELVKKLDAAKDLESKPKTYEIAIALGRLYYSSARYPEAAKFFLEATAKADPVIAPMRELAKKASTTTTADAAGCAWTDKTTLESAVKLAKEKASANPATGGVCARALLDNVASAHVLRGNALFLSGKPDEAISEYDKTLAISETRGDALYARAMTRLDAHSDDVKALQAARADLARLVQVAPTDPRATYALHVEARIDQAIAAGGMSKLNQKLAAERKAHPVQVASAAPMMGMPANHPPMGGGSEAPFAGGSAGGPPPLTKEMVDAVQNTERTPEMVAGLAKLVEEGEDHLAKGRYQDALDTYKRVVPFQPENGRAKAGMAWALVGLGKPMAERVWSVAVSSDPAAVDKLGETLRSKGDANGARQLWQRLAQSAPEYAKQANLSARF